MNTALLVPDIVAPRLHAVYPVAAISGKLCVRPRVDVNLPEGGVLRKTSRISRMALALVRGRLKSIISLEKVSPRLITKTGSSSFTVGPT